MFSIDHDSKLPLYHQVETIFRELIQRPEYQAGKLLPREVELAARLGVSRNTIRQATDKLVYEGLLVRKKGVGTRVNSKPVVSRLDNWISFTKEMEAKGLEVINYKLRVSTIIADEEIAAALHIQPDTEVIELYRLRGTKTFPALLTISWFHPRIGLRDGEDFSKPLYDLLDQNYSVMVVSSKEEIQAIPADENMARSLRISPGEPMLYRRRIVCDPGERPVEFNKTYYRSDSFTYSIDIKRNQL